MTNKTMKHLLHLLTLAILGGCNFNSSDKTESNALEKDSCESAVRFPAAIATEKMVKPNYSGELINYWGDDSTKLDFVHVFEDGELVHSRFYYENGNVQEEYDFKCQSIHGVVKFFWEDGKLAQVIPYRYGRREGVGERYDSLGVLQQKIVFKNDSVIGVPTDVPENVGKEIGIQ